MKPYTLNPKLVAGPGLHFCTPNLKPKSLYETLNPKLVAGPGVHFRTYNFGGGGHQQRRHRQQQQQGEPQASPNS